MIFLEHPDKAKVKRQEQLFSAIGFGLCVRAIFPVCLQAREYKMLNPRKSLIVALSFNFARHHQLGQNAVGNWCSFVCVCKPLTQLVYRVIVCWLCVEFLFF